MSIQLLNLLVYLYGVRLRQFSQSFFEPQVIE
jgi:hypothetical protein